MTHHDLVPELQVLSEDVLRATSPAAIAELLSRDLPMLIGAFSVRLYLANESRDALLSVPCGSFPEVLAAPIANPQAGVVAGAVRCFRQQTPVNLTSARRDTQVNPDGKRGLPRSAFFAPVVFGDEILGVVEALRNKPFGSFTAADLAAVKLLADQVGASLKLQQQNQTRERVLRGEQLSASGELIAATAVELRPALDKIMELCSTLVSHLPAHDRVLPELREEALRASEIVTRLMSYSGPLNAAVAPLDVSVLLNELVQFRTVEWNTLGLRVQNRLTPEPSIVLGHRGQIEHILLDLAIQAERSAAETKAKLLTISSNHIADRIVIEFTCAPDATISSASLRPCESVVSSHGGELHVRMRSDATAIVLELPLTDSAKNKSFERARSTSRELTLMVVDSDFAARQQLLGLLAARGHRVVPVLAEEASSLAQRMRFDGVIWAVRQGGSKWSEFQECLRDSIPTFVLATSGYDEAFASSLAGGGGFLLPRPVQETDLEKVLEAIDTRATARA